MHSPAHSPLGVAYCNLHLARTEPSLYLKQLWHYGCPMDLFVVTAHTLGFRISDPTTHWPAMPELVRLH